VCTHSGRPMTHVSPTFGPAAWNDMTACTAQIPFAAPCVEVLHAALDAEMHSCARREIPHKV
jgi:hypothetical protein